MNLLVAETSISPLHDGCLVPAFDTVRALFPGSHALCESSGFREKTHIQICVRNPEMIKGVFRVPRHHFSSK